MRHFFLTGASGIGKSTLLMEVLQEMEFPISGFLLKDSSFLMVLPEAFVSSLGAAGFPLLPHIRQKHPICS